MADNAEALARINALLTACLEEMAGWEPADGFTFMTALTMALMATIPAEHRAEALAMLTAHVLRSTAERDALVGGSLH